MKALVLVMLAAGLAAPALAADKDAAPAKKERLICKRDDTTGSRMAKQVCKTAAQWTAAEASETDGRLETLNRPSTTLDGTKPLAGPPKA